MSETKSLPRRREDIVLRDLGMEAMLYDPVADQVVRLNATSQQIWDLCDGKNDAAAIADELRRRFQADPEADLEADVRDTLDAFAQAGLFV